MSFARLALRQSLLSLRSAVPSSSRAFSSQIARPTLASKFLLQQSRSTPKWTLESLRAYSAASGLSKGDIEARIYDVLKSFEKVDPAKVRRPSVPSRILSSSSLLGLLILVLVRSSFLLPTRLPTPSMKPSSPNTGHPDCLFHE